MEKFIDRRDAGIALAKRLEEYSQRSKAIILALPRGGVPVAYEVAKALSLQLDVFIVRKLGVPGHEELAMGAIASGGTVIFNDEIINSLYLSESLIERVIQKEQKELERREKLYRPNLPTLELKDKTIILIDDGIATGATMHAAVQSIDKQKPRHLAVAVPVAACSTYKEFSGRVDNFVCLLNPVNFYAVGLWYDDFNQTTDEEVTELLIKANQ
ncbi:Putative phosphoribosyl transferasec/MT0597 [Legionella massiliensis]|uniref:Putative phosphoribosyl transferasec/MT0597 n=1 Tax=Legionella massiliensis TaxID=1034943 RepID=A0A078KW30_9GAMM|nr:phosphoribosyltransferase [Legionella massiliensis]CDZ78660.1 Putative phosphoribosyl transferasec/MT0597 [Legionella massiliensis]CEE14398.1 Putative phosphoribosyl transferase/MT0597 [Legionella massiliensis]